MTSAPLASPGKELTIDQTHWAPVRRRPSLPTYYYREHFAEMLDFVAAHYAHVLNDEHRHFIEAFHALPHDAQCLYVRLANRKGAVFATRRLRYPELDDVPGLVQMLRDSGWLGEPEPAHLDGLLDFLTRREILDVLIPQFPGVGRSLKKSELIAFTLGNCDAESFLENVDRCRVVVQKRVAELRYLSFLYFGKVEDNMSRFTMRDLGLVRTHHFRETYEPRFNDKTEALQHFYFALRLHRLKRIPEKTLRRVADEIDAWPDTDFAGSAALRDKLACRLGRKLELAGEIELARRAYAKGESARATERVIRLMLAATDRDAAERYLERCIDEPRSEEEFLIASDIYAQKFKKKRTSFLTDLLRAGETMDIDESRSGNAEKAVAEVFEGQGIHAFRTENVLWHTLFGLLFWDLLYTADGGTLHSPFDNLPGALLSGSFYDRYRDAIESRLAELDDSRATRRRVLQVSTSHYGTANGVFRWRRSVLDAVHALLEHAPADALRQILRGFCSDFRNARYGYPDLMLLEDERLRFVEVKAAGDQLRRRQMLRIHQLRDAGLPADVVQVRWILDPQQAYVVVDVETTGGRGENHRVTEIGAVRVQNGKITDKFQTLLNPQRAIPANISRLTGITHEMVAGAPYFADVADEVAAFLDGAIFVAHNVDFDYGFISREFARLGRKFRSPKLCTCAAMRKLYPGQASYSLGALARTFDIPLKQHHRALCDAEAAAELLLLINEKRLAALAA